MNLSAGQELHWDASLNPAALGNGALAFSYDDANRVKRIDVNPARASFQRTRPRGQGFDLSSTTTEIFG